MGPEIHQEGNPGREPVGCRGLNVDDSALRVEDDEQVVPDFQSAATLQSSEQPEVRPVRWRYCDASVVERAWLHVRAGERESLPLVQHEHR